MSLTPEEISQLSELLDARIGKENGPPKLRLIVPPTSQLLDSISRDAHLKRVAFLERRYGLHWLVEQECFDVASTTLLEDCDLIRLLTMMERARECIADGVSFEDADLVREPGGQRTPFIDRNAERRADDAAIAAAKMTALRPKPRTWSRSPF